MADLFGKQFYPTPKPLVLELIKDLRLWNKKVIDPSAGDGAILDVVSGIVNDKWDDQKRANRNLYAVEIDASLRAILIDKNYKVIDSDFLGHTGNIFFDFFLMNPPFSTGATHLLHAWEISRNATIRCLLNKANLVAPSTAKHEELLLLLETEKAEIFDMGKPFANSRNPTSVEVVLINLVDKRKTFKLDFTIDAEKIEDEFSVPELEDKSLVSANVFEAYTARYNATVEAFVRLLKAHKEVQHLMAEITPSGLTNDKIIQQALEKGGQAGYQHFTTETTAKAWDLIFEKTKLSRVVTKGVREKLQKQQQAQGIMAFNVANMKELMLTLTSNQTDVMTQCVLEAFDSLTKHHHDNRFGVEGWKTNGAYFVTKKVILPYCRENFGDGLGGNGERTFNDLERACCFLTGLKYDELEIRLRDIYTYRHNKWGQKIKTTFFECKFYRKGTLHIRWLDLDVWERFNLLVAKERYGQLPAHIKLGLFD